ncbi:MAG: glycoside hydrolase family 130 protein [Bacteroidales bacterium]|nr:glycoside hydrolase family 130 protein [Bacteroidales bacterium]
MQVRVTRKKLRFNPDPKRVIAQYSSLSDDTGHRIIQSVMKLNEDEVSTEISQVLRGYVKRHRNITRVFEKNFHRVNHLFEDLDIDPGTIDHNKKLLIGSYFTMEYSVEAAAFFNPSIVEHPDQSELHPGEKRIIMSFRATGEGHISSIVFRSGIIDKDNNLLFNERGRMLDEPQDVVKHTYDKKSFKSKLEMMKFYDKTLPPSVILDKLGDSFSYDELKKAVAKTEKNYKFSEIETLTLKQIMWLASSHYDIEFSMDTSLSERVIFPILDTEKNGIEDARFVRFEEDDGSARYFATYTAYDGSVILPKLIETESFYKFQFLPLDGEIAKNKGMALFPKRIKGKYAMLCRIDGASNYIAFSDDYTKWDDAELIQEPKYPWEFVKIGNCGSPIETDEGWLVLTHGVGQMREYVLGASLFDLDDPRKEIGRLRSPLMIPNEEEREGYVPNVIYSCGAMVNNGDLIIPYGISDFASTYASVDMEELLHALKNSG